MEHDPRLEGVFNFANNNAGVSAQLREHIVQIEVAVRAIRPYFQGLMDTERLGHNKNLLQNVLDSIDAIDDWSDDE